MSIFRLAMHPASEGDALILSWGPEDRPHRALIDLGRTGDYRALKPLLSIVEKFDLFCLTHIDADHIEGALPLFKEAKLPFTAERLWFNAHAQLVAANDRLPPLGREALGAVQAEKVSAGIVKIGWRWNPEFASSVVSIDSPEAAEPISLDGGLTLTILSPSDRKLAQLLPVWDQELAKAGLRTTDPDEVERALIDSREVLGDLNVDVLAATPFKIDTTRPNGASIVFIAEFDKRQVLLAADSHPDIIETALRGRGYSETNKLRLDCLKVSHHGSKANTSPALLKIIDCQVFAFSTDGSRHDHPDRETIARILNNDPDRAKTLYFNFRQPNTECWDDDTLKRRWRYECVFPHEGTEGIEFGI
ncbi:hypothetical protein GA0061105_1042 [Rhizobium aethiopicum]|uniref:Metallo-beta-lactamase superfamily protein n=1 Tax=Rhizobium aethiopicum TaxID=1138170 RepID=A0A1C3Y0S2_9HYPH|nr:hypothetical protein [Rhizobium aethiopicum]SCB58078.1 hypothetical protein GA0061105_1042 [Rhizobium aethiopicum]